MTAIAERARAKVNLTLFVRGRRADGYHEIDSLVAFAHDVADEVHLEIGGETAVRVAGPFAAAVTGDNIVAKAFDRLKSAEPRLRLGTATIRKNIPVAAGLGGGSADAAAILRAARRANPDCADRVDWPTLARDLGADVPVCLESRMSLMRGTGEQVIALADPPTLFAVLVNSMAAPPPDKTARVFAALNAPPPERFQGERAAPRRPLPLVGRRERQVTFERVGEIPTSVVEESTPTPSPSPQGEGESHAARLSSQRERAVKDAARFGEPSDVNEPAPTGVALRELIERRGNDLEAPARALMPDIADVIRALAETPGVLAARLSGAGPTCFGLYETAEFADAAARRIADAHPGWWVRASKLC